jgi:GTP:adenosylcobinamide-phosphate guanylyltransferase
MAGTQARERRADAIIIAGGAIAKEDLRHAVGVDCRALIDLLGKPMAQWTAEALRGAATIGRVILIGRPELRQTRIASVVDDIIDEGADEVENVFRGIEALPGAALVYMTAGDIPLVTPEAIDDIVLRAPPDADVVYPIVNMDDIERAYPTRKLTFARVPEGRYTGASCFLFRPDAVVANRRWVQAVFAARRNNWRLMRMWGLLFGIRAWLGRVSIPEAEAHCSEVLHLRARAYTSRFADLCMDVDYPPDVVLIRECLRQRLSPQAP